MSKAAYERRDRSLLASALKLFQETDSTVQDEIRRADADTGHFVSWLVGIASTLMTITAATSETGWALSGTNRSIMILCLAFTVFFGVFNRVLAAALRSLRQRLVIEAKVALTQKEIFEEMSHVVPGAEGARVSDSTLIAYIKQRSGRDLRDEYKDPQRLKEVLDDLRGAHQRQLEALDTATSNAIERILAAQLVPSSVLDGFLPDKTPDVAKTKWSRFKALFNRASVVRYGKIVNVTFFVTSVVLFLSAVAILCISLIMPNT